MSPNSSRTTRNTKVMRAAAPAVTSTRARAAASKSSRPSAVAAGQRPLAGMSSRECTVLALVLVERLSLSEAASALEISVTQLRRDYEAALVRVRRSIAPLLERADLARALSRPSPAWRKAS